jgi:ABC-type transporter Mla maintaining outer membrane lipid asymmetry permease subunit MlaE
MTAMGGEVAANARPPGGARRLDAVAALVVPAALADGLEHLGGIVLLGRDTLRAMLRGRWEGRLLLAQLEQIGVRSLSIVVLTAIFTGMVLALQMGASSGSSAPRSSSAVSSACR